MDGAQGYLWLLCFILKYQVYYHGEIVIIPTHGPAYPIEDGCQGRTSTPENNLV